MKPTTSKPEGPDLLPQWQAGNVDAAEDVSTFLLSAGESNRGSGADA